MLVPRRNGTRGLNSWLTAQRFKKARGTLKHEEELELEAVGVKWEVRRSWSEMLKLLQSFKQEHGNCDVPQGYPDVPGLGAWVTYQRTLRRSNRWACCGFVFTFSVSSLPGSEGRRVGVGGWRLRGGGWRVEGGRGRRKEEGGRREEESK